MESAAKAATMQGVEVTSLRRYNRGRMAQERLQLGFAAVEAGEIRRGVCKLAVALEEELRALQRRGRCDFQTARADAKEEQARLDALRRE